MRTYPLDKTIDYIQRYFGFENWQIKIMDACNGIQKIGINIPNIHNNVEIVKNKMKLCGYFLGWPTKEELDKHKNEWIWLNFEPKFQNNNTEEIKKEHRFLYHITPSYNLTKIKQIGLSPRHRNTNFYFPSRIYLMFDDDELGNIDNSLNRRMMAFDLSDFNKSKGNNGNYNILTIDTAKIGDNVNLYYVPNYSLGCFTTDNIRPNSIIKVENIKVK